MKCSPLVAAVTLALPALVHGQGGEDAASATPIPTPLPYSDTGTTIGFLDDSDEVCSYTGSTSPDVYYAFTPDETTVIRVSLCASDYDTKTYVYDSTLSLVMREDGTLACDDDGCETAPFRSFLDCVPVEAGETYYIVVDGWGGDAGPYGIDVNLIPPGACQPCTEIECPPGATIEGEPCAFGDPEPNDTFNGGCNGIPATFGSIACDETICGDAYFDGSFRDTDWYEIDTTGEDVDTSFTLSGTATFGLLLGRTYCGSVSCSCTPTFLAFDIAGPCEVASITTAILPPGVYTFVVAPDFTEIVQCDGPAESAYAVALTCASPLPPCPWDLDGDQVIGFDDLLQVLSNWGPCPGA